MFKFIQGVDFNKNTPCIIKFGMVLLRKYIKRQMSMLIFKLVFTSLSLILAILPIFWLEDSLCMQDINWFKLVLIAIILFIFKKKFVQFSKIVSFIYSLLFLYVYIKINYVNGINYVYFLPFLVIFFVNFIFPILSKRDNKFVLGLSLFLNFALIFYQMLLLLYVYIMFSFIDASKIYNKSEDYNAALKSISHYERVFHFPKEIPFEASNVELFKTADVLHGKELVLLKFTIDKNYIENELKKYKFIQIETPDNYKQRYFMLKDEKFDFDGVTFYVIGGVKNKEEASEFYSYNYGIGVNEKFNKIIYFYIKS